MPLKESYFTPQTLSSKAQGMLDSLAKLIRKRPVTFLPERSALLVLDMQTYFTDPSSHACVPGASAILPGINALLRAYHDLGLPVIFTRHLNTPQNAGQMATWWRDLLSPDNPFSIIDPRLEIRSATMIHKAQYDAFLDTKLEELLREMNVCQLVICGVMTHLCCETTARSAFMRGFEVFFTVDGTATYNEAFHYASLLNLAHGFAVPVLLSNILQQLEVKRIE